MSDELKKELSAVRGEIDAIDAQLLELLNRRAGCAQKVGEIKAADQALYSAKGAGRNRVVAHGQVRRGAVRVAAVEA